MRGGEKFEDVSSGGGYTNGSVQRIGNKTERP